MVDDDVYNVSCYILIAGLVVYLTNRSRDGHTTGERDPADNSQSTVVSGAVFLGGRWSSSSVSSAFSTPARSALGRPLEQRNKTAIHHCNYTRTHTHTDTHKSAHRYNCTTPALVYIPFVCFVCSLFVCAGFYLFIYFPHREEREGKYFHTDYK